MGGNIIRLQVLVIRFHFPSIWPIRAVLRVGKHSVFVKRPLTIAAMNAELPPVKNG